MSLSFDPMPSPSVTMALALKLSTSKFETVDESAFIVPVIVPFRHRWFWDGGVHCVTQDLYRERNYS